MQNFDDSLDGNSLPWLERQRELLKRKQEMKKVAVGMVTPNVLRPRSANLTTRPWSGLSNPTSRFAPGDDSDCCVGCHSPYCELDMKCKDATGLVASDTGDERWLPAKKAAAAAELQMVDTVDKVVDIEEDEEFSCRSTSVCGTIKPVLIQRVVPDMSAPPRRQMSMYASGTTSALVVDNPSEADSVCAFIAPLSSDSDDSDELQDAEKLKKNINSKLVTTVIEYADSSDDDGGMNIGAKVHLVKEKRGSHAALSEVHATSATKVIPAQATIVHDGAQVSTIVAETCDASGFSNIQTVPTAATESPRERRSVRFADVEGESTPNESSSRKPYIAVEQPKTGVTAEESTSIDIESARQFADLGVDAAVLGNQYIEANPLDVERQRLVPSDASDSAESSNQGAAPSGVPPPDATNGATNSATAGERAEGTGPRARASPQNFDATFTYNPAPRDVDVQCRISRHAKSNDTTYFMHLDGIAGMKVFLLAAKKRWHAGVTSYIITRDPTCVSSKSDEYVGKMRSNFVGTSFVLYDNGRNPKRGLSRLTPAEKLRQELALITYETNVMGWKGPRRMRVVLPGMNADYQRIEIRPTSEADGLAALVKRNDFTNLLDLHNKVPVWNEETQSYVLNFHGRVTHASVKNFQIVQGNNDDYTLMQFGRTGDNAFTLDYRYPMCALQAFAIAITSFDRKLACE